MGRRRTGAVTVASAHFQCTDYLERKALDHLFGVSSFTLSDLWLALSTTTPTEAGTLFTEPSAANGYARVQVNVWDAPTVTLFAASSPFGDSEVYTLNTNVVDFPTATGSWGTPTYAGLWDAGPTPATGNLLWYGLSGGGPIPTGQFPRFAAGSLRLELERENALSVPGTFTPTVKTNLLNHLALRATYTPPNPLYAGICTTLNVANETYTETTDASYARQSMASRWAAAATVSGQTRTLNTGSDLVFGPATTNIASRLVLLTAAAGGNLFAWCADVFGGFATGPGSTVTLKAGGIAHEVL